MQGHSIFTSTLPQIARINRPLTLQTHTWNCIPKQRSVSQLSFRIRRAIRKSRPTRQHSKFVMSRNLFSKPRQSLKIKIIRIQRTDCWACLHLIAHSCLESRHRLTSRKVHVYCHRMGTFWKREFTSNSQTINLSKCRTWSREKKRMKESTPILCLTKRRSICQFHLSLSFLHSLIQRINIHQTYHVHHSSNRRRISTAGEELPSWRRQRCQRGHESVEKTGPALESRQ